MVLKNFTILEKKLLIFFKEYAKMIPDAGFKAKQDEKKQNKTKQDGTKLKILTPKQKLRRLPIALAQVKAGNNSKIY